MRLLLALATHHAAAPGLPMSADTLCEHVWPGERIMPEAATNRLYVTGMSSNEVAAIDLATGE
jgi:hypothetical protein